MSYSDERANTLNRQVLMQRRLKLRHMEELSNEKLDLRVPSRNLQNEQHDPLNFSAASGLLLSTTALPVLLLFLKGKSFPCQF